MSPRVSLYDRDKPTRSAPPIYGTAPTTPPPARDQQDGTLALLQMLQLLSANRRPTQGGGGLSNMFTGKGSRGGMEAP